MRSTYRITIQRADGYDETIELSSAGLNEQINYRGVARAIARHLRDSGYPNTRLTQTTDTTTTTELEF